VTSIQSATSYGFGQLQRQQAQRSVAQAEARAEALAAQAASARKEADTAQSNARDIEIQAGMARSEADSSRMSVSSAQGFDQIARKVSSQVDRLALAATQRSESGAIYGKDASTRSVSPTQPGQIINVVA